jgi:hypothetical protein
MLHHAEIKLYFWLMHMFEIFKFEFVVWLDLNSIEKKIKENRLGIQNKKKSQRSPITPHPGLSAQVAHLPLPGAHLPPQPYGPCMSTPSLTRLLSGPHPSAPLPITALVCLCHRLAGLGCQLHLPSLTTSSQAHHGRAHVTRFSATTHTPDSYSNPLLPARPFPPPTDRAQPTLAHALSLPPKYYTLNSSQG